MTAPNRLPGAYDHVMNRGLDHTPVFEADADHRRFTRLLQDTVRMAMARG